MEATTHISGSALDLVLFSYGLLFATLGWLIRGKLKDNDDKHKETQAIITDMSTRFQRRGEAFNNVITNLDKDLRALLLSDDEILAIVNGKYISRREYDAANISRSEWRALLTNRLDKMDKLIERMREFRDHDYNSDRQNEYLRFGIIEKELAVWGVKLHQIREQLKISDN